MRASPPLPQTAPRRRTATLLGALVLGLAVLAAAPTPAPARLDRKALLGEIRRKLDLPLETVATPTRPLGMVATPPPTPAAAAPVPASAPESPASEAAAALPGVVPDGATASLAAGLEDTGLLTTIHDKMVAGMRKVVHDPATLTVVLEPRSAADTATGSFRRVLVHTENGEIDGLRIERADFTFHGVQIDLPLLLEQEKIESRHVDHVDLEASITQAALNAFLAAKARKIKVHDPHIELRRDDITVSGATRYGIIKATFWATGKFTVKSADKIYFNPKRFKLNNLTMPRAFVHSIVERINPVLDLAKFPFRLNLREISVEPGRLRFR